jgi:hypothetical protein
MFFARGIGIIKHRLEGGAEQCVAEMVSILFE